MPEALTEARIARAVKDGLPEGKNEIVLPSDSMKGLGLRLRAGGAATWVYMFRPHGAGRCAAPRRMTIGRWPSLKSKQAHDAASVLAGEIAMKKDPAAERREAKSHDKRILSHALDSYEVEINRRGLVNTDTIMSVLRRGLQPLLAREIDTLTRKDFVDRIDALEAIGKPGAAQDLRSRTRSMLEWAVGRGLIPFNPLAGLRRPRSSRIERLQDARKGHALDDREIVALWKTAGDLGPFGGLVRLALLTGFRRNELSGLRWPDVHVDRIVVEAERTKMGVQHEVPLTGLMKMVLSAQPRTTSDLVFPNRSDSRMIGWTELVARAIKLSGVEFRLHDLRRTTRTIMSKLNIRMEIAEAAIGHVRSGLVATYDKNDFWSERVDAFENMSAHIAKIIASNGDENEGDLRSSVVTTFRSAAVAKSA